MTCKEKRIQLTQYGNGEPKFELNEGGKQFSVKQLFVYQISFYVNVKIVKLFVKPMAFIYEIHYLLSISDHICFLQNGSETK